MVKHKSKIIAAVLVLAVLVAAWFFGGNYNKNDDISVAAPTPETLVSARIEEPPVPSDVPPEPSASSDAPTEAPILIDVSAETPAPIAIPSEKPPETQSVPEITAAATPMQEPDTGQDQYLTEPGPEGNPLPVEPQDVVAGDGSFTVTLSVNCHTILDNMNLLSEEKHELVPEDGVIFSAAEVTAYEGESVFNILQREMKRAKIHMEFMNTPIYNSAYLEGINNLYEFDAGELSGWFYSVNGWFPNYGSSRYPLQPGDTVEWLYSCDLGRDVGAEWLEGGQKDE